LAEIKRACRAKQATEEGGVIVAVAAQLGIATPAGKADRATTRMVREPRELKFTKEIELFGAVDFGVFESRLGPRCRSM